MPQIIMNSVKCLIFAFVTLSQVSCTQAKTKPCKTPLPPTQQSHWFEPQPGPIKGVVLAVHGLNQNPQALNPLIHMFNDMNLSVYRLSLPGHRGECQEQLTSISAEDFVASFRASYSIAKTEAQQLNVPLYLFGYSTGSLLGFVLPTRSPEIRFDKMIHIAPALRVRLYTHVVRLLFPFVDMIPSRSPEAYRANQGGTSVALYRTFFHFYSQVEDLSPEQLNQPSLIFIHPHDELVSAQGLRKMKEEYDLDQWSIHSLQKPKASRSSYAHLVIDPQTMSEASWVLIKSQVAAFLETKNK